jgi:hypothetical protein
MNRYRLYDGKAVLRHLMVHLSEPGRIGTEQYSSRLADMREITCKWTVELETPISATGKLGDGAEVT